MIDSPPALQPSSSPDDALLDRALANTRRTRETVIATIATAINGALILLQVTQLFYYFHFYRDWVLLPPSLLIAGLALLALASKLYSQRVWAAVGATVVSAVSALAVGFWCVTLLRSGGLSLLSELVPLTSAAGAVLAGRAIGPCRRTAAARKQAAAAGLDIDL